jgi:hypothetical protein
MKLYTHALSPFSGKVRALDEKGLQVHEEQLRITRQAVVLEPKALLDARCPRSLPTGSCSTTRP